MENGKKIRCRIRFNKTKLVRYFYEMEDESWHLEVHENSGSVEENIKDSVRSISPESVMYEVLWMGRTAAAFTKYRDEFGNLAMEFFHVSKGFRNPDFFSEFWSVARRVFVDDFWIAVYQQNQEAVTHLSNQGFELCNSTEHRGKKIFIFKANKLCQFQPQLH